MNPNQFRKYRILFIKSGCPHCKQYCEFIERINSKLPINKRIKIVNCDLIKFGIIEDPITLLFNNMFDGFPTFFCDGQKIDGSNSRIETETLINSLVSNDYMIPETNEFIFTGECSIQKSGFLKRRIICK